MKHLAWLVTAALLFLSSACRATAVDLPVQLKRTPLTSVAAVTSLDAPPDPDDPGVGGGFDAQTYFKESLVPNLEECTERIENVTDAWSRSHGFTIPKREKGLGSFLAHATKPDAAGFFEIVYRVDAKRERARVTVYYYSNDGTQHEPAGIERLLKDYGIADLQDKLNSAIQCQGPKK